MPPIFPCRLRAIVVALAVLAGVVRPVLAAAAPSSDPLVVDLSNHLVASTTGFTGASVLLFGAVEGDGDVVVVVRGPAEPQTVRRKERVLGVWANRAAAQVLDAPVYYRVASTRPLDKVASLAVLDRHQIGLDHLDIRVKRRDKGATDVDYRKAVLRLKHETGLYSEAPGQVTFVGGRLFRAEMELPANVPTGTYTVEVYLLRGGEVVSAQTTPLIISKSGLDAEVFDFAHRQAALYGLLAIVLAASSGWLAAAALKRR